MAGSARIEEIGEVPTKYPGLSCKLNSVPKMSSAFKTILTMSLSSNKCNPKAESTRWDLNLPYGSPAVSPYEALEEPAVVDKPVAT